MKALVALVLSSLAGLAVAQAQPTLAVDATANVHPISPYIYGINEYSDIGLASTMRIPVRRWGGDADTSYNWQIDVSNSASDWYFENFPQYSGTPALPDGGSFDRYHEANLRSGTFSLTSIPILDWTPKDDTSCSYSVAKYGTQQKVMNGCGNGMLPNGTQIWANPSDAYQPSDAAFEQQWVKYIMNRYGPANAGGVRLWSMDNEPEWWYSVHIDIYQTAATYDDMMSRNLTWAQAVKAVDPTALITGPVPGGWSGMLFSRTDMDSGWGTKPWDYWDNPTDYDAHGKVYWVPYYLQQMQNFEQQNGYRLLDVLDVHGYLTPSGLSGTVGNAAMEKLRMTSTRVLWDPAYLPPGGGYEDVTGAEVAPALVPRMRGWVADNYPGTKIGITEYQWQALGSITGAIAQADVMGIFGREQLDYGLLWGPPAPTDPGAFAFRMFLNYDGNGSQFGGTSVSATTEDPDTLSIFAAQRYDSALTVLVLNKTTGPIADTISLADFTPAGTAQVWQYSQTNLGAIVRQPDLSVAGNGLSMTFPAYSMTLLAIPQAQSAMSVPQPVVNAVTSAASYDASGVSPGEIVAIWGQGMGPAAAANLTLDENGLLTTSLGGTQVFVNGNPAPLTYASNGQVNAVVPYEVATAAAANVVVVYQGNASAPLQIPIAPTKPGILTTGSGQGQGAILNQDYSLNAAANPAQRGTWVSVYGTGEGVTTPPGVDGRVSAVAGTPLPSAVAICTATIGGQPATTNYCGEAPGFTSGVLQVNAKVPDSIAPGSAVPMTITIGGVTSQAGITLAVQ